MDPVTVLMGVGKLYVAPVGTAFPEVNAAPGGSWTNLGYTVDGVTITKGQSIEEVSSDQETGPVKARRTEETLVVETKLLEATLENLGKLLALTVTDTAPGAGSIGTRKVGLYQGGLVTEYAFLFRGDSPYGASYPAQYEVPRGYFTGDIGIEHTKDGAVVFPCEFHALVDPDAASEDEKFGRLVAQDAAAL